MRNNTTYNKGLITWTGLASSAEVTFIPVLLEKGQPGAAIFIERLEAMRMSSVLPAARSPSNGASITINFLSQPFPE